LQSLPRTIGDWQGQDQELDARQLQIGEIAGYVARRYEHARTRSSFTVLLVCGRAGPIAVHTPDVCYAGNGFVMAGGVVPYTAHYGDPPRQATFAAAKLVKEAAVPTHLRIWWAWDGDGTWRTPAQPRWTYAGQPFLYKLYVIREMASGEDRGGDEAVAEFLKVFLPELDGCLASEG
jgi:hypothetical protein